MHIPISTKFYPNIIQELNNILTIAVNKNASDIHFETYKNLFRIRFRIDGILYEYSKTSQENYLELISRIKILANLNIAEKRLPQDGHFSLTINDNNIEFRVSSCPTVFGEKVVLRLILLHKNTLKILNLGMEHYQTKKYICALSKQQGLILITGPTGSGKTFSMYAGLNHINCTTKNIITIEDPVEINLENINQININNKIGITYSNMLKTILRQDPDIIMIGEIRDQEVAEIAIKASQTGHLILSTLHTNNAKETINRLNYLGISIYNILTSVTLIISQRLLRKLCKYCKIKSKLTYNNLTSNNSTHNNLSLKSDCDFNIKNKILSKYKFSNQELKNIIFYQANTNGCNKCNDGYFGRIGIFELLPIKYDISKFNNFNSAEHYLSSLLKDSNFSLLNALQNKIKEGLTSLEEGYKFLQ